MSKIFESQRSFLMVNVIFQLLIKSTQSVNSSQQKLVTHKIIKIYSNFILTSLIFCNYRKFNEMIFELQGI